MRAVQKHAEPATAQLSLRRSERLWFHYCGALLIILCLLVATYILNRVVVDRGLLAVEGIQKSNEQVVLAQDITATADLLVNAASPDFASFEKAINQLELMYSDVVAAQIRSDRLKALFFGEGHSLHQKMSEFIELAKRFATGRPDQRGAVNERLKGLHGTDGLHNDLSQAASLVAAQVKAEAAYFTMIQRGMLAASALVLLAEAIFIFLPAQRSFQSSIHSMRIKTSALRASQAQLTEMNRKLEHMVRHDQLTGLPNRRALTEYLDQATACQRIEDWSLLLVGLDGFKSVNDMVGHDYGDALLVAVSHALQSCVDEEHLVARVGGDEFALITSEPTAYLIKRIMAAFQDPFAIKGRRIPVNTSIGHLEIGNEVRQPLDILADAEVALQYAKNIGGNRAQAFTQILREDLGTMQQLQLDLTDAIRNGEIEPWFQPQVRLSDGRLHGAEVLARWRHPTRGLLMPDVFLPAAEQAGMMVDLDHAVWRSAMHQAKAWETANVWRPVISLNAAPDTIADPYFLERFLLSLQRSGLDADQVIVEVLETTLISGKDDVAAINIDSLADCGIALELDDFGTGYASLSRLTQLPLAGIKLDRSLVAPLPDQAADSVVRAILALATELGLHVIAEGIEENVQAAHLNKRGCSIGQGYGFGKPMPAQEFTLWLTNNATTKLQAGPDIARLA